LGVDAPFYAQVFRNISVPSPQSYPATYNSTGSSNSNDVSVPPASAQTIQLQSSNTSGQPMIVRTADLSMAVTDITTAVSQITQLANNNNGYVVSANQTSTDKSISGVISIRIPAGQFESTMSALRDIAVKVTSENVSASDVSQEYTDLSAKLTNSETAKAQLTEIMQKAEKVEDVLAVENQLIATQGDIEVTKSRMQYLEQTTAMSLITINLQQSTLTISLYAGTSYARTKDNIGFSVDIQGGIAPFSYQWDFGDGAKSVDAAPWHKYNAAGTYNVSVTVTDDKGNKAEDNRTNYITIIPGWSPGDILDGAWRGFLSFFRFLYAVFVWLLMFSPIIIVIVLIWYFARRSLKRRKAKIA
jgi:PKD repeat protein